MDASTQASSLLSKLENYDFTSINTLFNEYLQPFASHISPKPQNPNKKPSRTKKPSQSPSIRSLAKTFLPFVNRCLSHLPKRLSETPKHPKTREHATELLDCYKMCLDCLDVVASELSGKPYSVHLQRARYVHCLIRWERYEDGIDVGFRVLKDVGETKLQGPGWRVSMGEAVPVVEFDCGDGNGGVEADVVHLIVDLAIAVAQCVVLSKAKDAGKYTGLLVLLREVRPWFRHLELGACTKLQWKLLNHLKNVAVFLIREASCFEGGLVPQFCAAVFDWYTQLLNVQSRQGATTEELQEFVKFVSNCTYKCQSACKNVRVSIAMQLYESAGNFSQDLVKLIPIQRLYALGLYFSESRFKPNCLLPEGWDKLQHISALLSCCKNYYTSNSQFCDNPPSDEFSDFFDKRCICSSFVCKALKSTNVEAYRFFYLDALKFLCWPLAEFITSERKRIVTEDMDSPFGIALKLVQEAFVEYSCFVSFCQQNQDPHVEIDMIVLNISVAAFSLSLKQNLWEGSPSLIDIILSDKYLPLLQPQMLKYIIAMLHNNFVELYRHELLKEALEALDLCCRASWSRCLLFCEMLTGKQKGFDGDLSENMIVESVNEAGKVNSLLIDVFHKTDSCKVEKVTRFGLEKWCLARNLSGQLPCPVVLIKSWAKIQYKVYKNIKGNALILGNSLLGSPCMASRNISIEAVGIILEQELLVYQEMSTMYPMFCLRMQREIVDVLLQEVYYSSKCMLRSIILVKKGMLLRTLGIEGLEECVDCLSDAIEVINGSCGMPNDLSDKVSNQLAVVYCLRGLSTHEVNPTSKEVFHDIRVAVNLWSKCDIIGCSSSGNANLYMGCDYVLLLLYHVADLLSIKGNMNLHSDVLNVIIKVFKQMKVTLDKCLLLLWESRRVNHALCVVPVSEALIKALSEHYGAGAESLDVWISSLKDSQPLLAGLQQNFSFLSSLFPLAFHQLQHSLQLEISVDEVKDVASKLISNAPVSRSSAFLAGYLYYDLSERLIVCGRTIEALFCAKEAHQLRGKLLQEHFSYSFKQHEAIKEPEEIGRKPSDCIHQFSVLNHVAVGHWPSNTISQDSSGLFFTPWNVLRCYLESTLQVGIIHERLGNFLEAEAQFMLGKSISCLQSLSQFIVSFSSCLGKVYYGKGLLVLAQNELVDSMRVLGVERDSLTCSKCLLVLESYINEHLGNLYRKGFSFASGNPYKTSLQSLIFLEKDDLAVWLEGASAVHPKRGDDSINAVSETRTDHDCVTASSGINDLSKPTKTKAKSDIRRSKKAKEQENQARVKSNAAERNSRVTRSSHAKGSGLPNGAGNVTNSYSNGHMKSEATITCNRVCCQKCFSSELILCGSFTSFIRMRWEFFRRRQILRLLIGLGKCQEALLETHTLHTIYSKCISMLLGGNDCHCSSSTLLNLDCIGTEVPGDILAGERAEVLYNLCRLSSKALYSKDIGSSCCDSCELCCIKMPHVVSFLMLSFVLSREVPLLFQKVSRLLALIHVVSASRKTLSSLSSSKGISDNNWAAYFHQASVGNHHNLQLLSALELKRQPLNASKGSNAAAANSMIEDTCMLLRMIPDSTSMIKSSVENFFENLPSTTIVCMSLLGASYTGLLDELTSYSSGVPGWLLLSHLNADSQPAVLLLPLNTVLQDEDLGFSCSVFGEKNVQKEWCSPWGCNAVIDDVAPTLKSILRGNYLSCSNILEEHTEKSRKVWWTWRDNLDKSLQKFLQDMEETWFGQWKFMLLGRWLDSEPLNSAVKDLINDRKTDGCKWDLNESILKVVMGGIKSANADKVRIPKLFLEKGCYIGNIVDFDERRSYALDKACDTVDHVSDTLIAAVSKVELEYCTRREPVVLVLDTDVQMLPLENMPIMREQEVYRMPSVTSILVALQRKVILDEAARIATKFPLIDPLDAFYLLNPSGDLSRTQTEFEEWFRHQNIQGKAGAVPSSEELSAALESRDLFLYFGHGSGAQYIPRDKIQKLENCAAVLLMGCSSGTLNLNGCYAPVGTSLSYMLAGAPIVVANLWEVTDLDIDRFAKVVLKSFLEERSMSSTGCIQCSLLAEELKSMTVKEKKGSKKGRGRKKTVEPKPDEVDQYCFRHKLRAGYFVSQARKACKLPFLIGAAPVCYGVPTGIRKKQD